MSNPLKSFISISPESTEIEKYFNLWKLHCLGWSSLVVIVFRYQIRTVLSPWQAYIPWLVPQPALFSRCPSGERKSEVYFETTISTLTLPDSCLCAEHLPGSGLWSSLEPGYHLTDRSSSVNRNRSRSSSPGMLSCEVRSCPHQQTWPTQSILRPTNKLGIIIVIH